MRTYEVAERLEKGDLVSVGGDGRLFKYPVGKIGVNAGVGITNAELRAKIRQKLYSIEPVLIERRIPVLPDARGPLWLAKLFGFEPRDEPLLTGRDFNMAIEFLKKII